MKGRIILPLLAVLTLAGCGQTAPLRTPGTLSTPKYTLSPAPQLDFSSVREEEIHTSDEGIIRIESKGGCASEPPTLQADSETASLPQELPTPETVWEEDQVVTYNGYTLPERVLLEEDCLGVLSIPAIELEMKVYEAENEMEAMLKGGVHYKDTTAWDGNVGISTHNSGVPEAVSFGRLQELNPGDIITYRTALGERRYKVETILEISDEDWSWLGRTADNRMTLTTCITGKPDKRLMVQGVEKR